MNAQQQDIIRLLTSRGPMTSRELFEVMQEELGYYGFAASQDQIQRAVESLSKILSKMKSEKLINGEMSDQPKGRPVMAWSAPISNQQIDTTLISSQYDNPDDDTENDFGMMTETPTTHDDEHAEMESDIPNGCHDDPTPEHYLFEVCQDLITIKSGTVMRPKSLQIRQEWGLCVMLDGVVMIRNRAELAQFIGAIERMLP